MLAKTKRGLGILAVASCCLALSAQQLADSRILWDFSTASWFTPPGATADDHVAFLQALMQGDPLPPGYVLEDEGGSVTCVLTAGLKPSGARRAVATVIDDQEDLEEAYVYVEGQIEATATRANGKIQDLSNGKAEATLGFWLEPQGLPYSVEVRWKTNEGIILKQEATYKEAQ